MLEIIVSEEFAFASIMAIECNDICQSIVCYA